MPVEQEIQQLAHLVKHIEDYAAQGVWQAERHQEILATMEMANTVFRKIIDVYIESDNPPSMPQAMEVSDLQERLHEVMHHLPLPPLDPVHAGAGTDKSVFIYTTPT